MTFTLETLQTAIGEVQLITDGQAIRALDFTDYSERMHTLLRRHYRSFELQPTPEQTEFARQLEAYFAGDLQVIDHLPVATNGTRFQQQVWAALRKIPLGQTCSYGHIAAQIGNPAACRAVGLANGSNPVAIVVPCHRVIGSNAKLTGYGGGLSRKEWLLRHEGALAVTAG